MRSLVKARNMALTDSVKAYVERRIEFTFSRSQHVIQSLTVTLADINGPKGGNDKQCKVLVRVNGLPDLVIVDRQVDLHHAIDRALFRASHNILQRLKRKQHTLQRRYSHRTFQPESLSELSQLAK